MSDLIEGKKGKGKWTDDVKRNAMRQIRDALVLMHGVGLYHMDLKARERILH